MIARELRVSPSRDPRVERAAPRVADDLDVVDRVARRRHRPEHVEGVGRVDVVVHHHDEPPQVGARLAGRGQQPGLLGVTGVGLLDRDDVEQPRRAGLVAPDALHPGQPRRARPRPRSSPTSSRTCCRRSSTAGGSATRPSRSGRRGGRSRLTRTTGWSLRAAGVVSGELAERSLRRDVAGIASRLPAPARPRRASAGRTARSRRPRTARRGGRRRSRTPRARSAVRCPTARNSSGSCPQEMPPGTARPGRSTCPGSACPACPATSTARRGRCRAPGRGRCRR